MAPLRGWAPRGQRLIAKVPLWSLEHHDLCRRLAARSDRSAMAARWPCAPTISQTQDMGAPDIIRLQDYRPVKRRKLTRFFRDGRRQQRMRRSMSERPLDLGVGPHRNAVGPDTNLLNESIVDTFVSAAERRPLTPQWSGAGSTAPAGRPESSLQPLLCRRSARRRSL
jgi:hypothetical protein